MDLTGCEAFLAHRYGHATRRGNEAAILRHVESALASLGFTARAAVAPTVGLAWAACRFGDESIESSQGDELLDPTHTGESFDSLTPIESAEASAPTDAREADAANKASHANNASQASNAC